MRKDEKCVFNFNFRGVQLIFDSIHYIIGVDTKFWTIEFLHLRIYSIFSKVLKKFSRVKVQL